MSVLTSRLRVALLSTLPLMLVAAPAPAALPPATNRAIVPIALPYDRFTLPNGLTVVVHTDHSVPTVFVGLWYRVGAKDEPAGRSGFAHLFEHLMFQQTSHRKGDFLAAMATLGGSDINAMTTSDHTMFHEVVADGALDRTLWLEADRMAHLAEGLTQGELDRQRDVVKNEKRQGELRPGALSRARLLATLYPAGHPYAHDPIGSMADIDAATLPQVKTWLADYYGARNAVLVLSGDITLDAAKRKVATYFGGVAAGPIRTGAAPWVPDLTANHRETVHEPVPNGTLTRTWVVPSAQRHDLALLQLGVAALTAGRDAPLVQALTGADGPALGVNADVTEQQLVSTVSITLALRPGIAPGRAERLFDTALARSLAKGPDPDALAAILLPAEAQLLRSLDTAAAAGRQLGDDLVGHGDPAYVLQRRRWYAAATPATIQAAERRWLTRPYHQLVTLPGPADPAPAERAESPAAAPALPAAPLPPPPTDTATLPMPPVAPPDGHVRFPAVTRMTLANGLTLVVAERHRLPIVEFAMRFPVGSSDDPADRPDLVEDAFGLLGAGTTTLDEAALARRAGTLGLSFGARVDDRASTFAWNTLAATLDPSFALAADVLRHPAYPPQALARRAADAGAGFDAFEQEPQTAAPALLRRALWGADHPFGRIPTRAQAAVPPRAALLAFHDRAIVPAGATLFAIGDITPARARALAERYFGTTPAAPAATQVVPPPAGAGPRIVLVDAPGAPQSLIAVGALVRPFAAARMPAEQMADTALAASGGRLNAALRDARGWSYGFAGGIADTPGLPRLFSASGSVETDKTAHAIALIRSTIADFTGRHPVTPVELATYKEGETRGIPASLASSGAILSSMMAADALDLPPDHARGAADRIAAVTLDQARTAAHDLYRPDALSFVVVGDLKRIEAPVRALGIAPVEVWDVYGHRLR